MKADYMDLQDDDYHLHDQCKQYRNFNHSGPVLGFSCL